MNLEKLLTEVKNSVESKNVSIPIKKGEETSYIPTIKKRLENSNLKNIKLADNQKEKVFATDPDGNIIKNYVKSNEKLSLNCVNHPDEKITGQSVEDLNSMLDRFNSNQTTGKLNPCPTENNENKNITRVANNKKPLGAFDSKEEQFVYDTVVDYIKTKPILNGCIVRPLNGTGKKFYFDDIDKKRDADVYLEYTNEISKLLNGKKGLAFLIDGSTHYGTNIKNAVFVADEARSHSKKVNVARISVFDIENKHTGEIEKENIKKWIITNINNLISAIPQENGIVKKESHISKSQGEAKKGEVLQREMKKQLNQELLTRIITNLRGRETTPPFWDKENNYHSDKYGEMKLSTFLRPGNEKSGYVGKMSFEKYPDLWKELVGASTEFIRDWKAKHQAKNGEKLFSGTSNKDRKLFESNKNSAN